MRQLNKDQARGLKMPKPKAYPWDDDQDVSKFGHVEDGDEVAALEYLQGLSSPA